MTLIIDDRVKTRKSHLDFTILRNLCEKEQLWPRKIILRKPNKEEKKDPDNNTGYYCKGYLVFIIHDRKYSKRYFDHLQAHEYRHMMQVKLSWLKKTLVDERSETVRKMILAVISLGPITQELLGVDNDNCFLYDPEELDADIFAVGATKRVEPKRKYETREKNENTTPITSNKS